MERLQIDNELRGTPCEVLLWPGKSSAKAPVANSAERGADGSVASSTVRASSGVQAREHPFVHVSVIKARGGEVVHYRYASLLVQEFNVSVESAFLLRFVDFVGGELLPALERTPTALAAAALPPKVALYRSTARVRLSREAVEEALARGGTGALNVYCETVQIFPIKARCSYRSVPGTTSRLKQRLSVAFGTLSALGLANVYQSPITLRGLLIEHVSFKLWCLFFCICICSLIFFIF